MSRRKTTVVVVLVLAALVGSFGLMLDEASHSGDWPGWDEGWALIAFPLGIPVAVAAAIGVGRSALSVTNVRLVVLVTGATAVGRRYVHRLVRAGAVGCCIPKAVRPCTSRFRRPQRSNRSWC